MIEKTGPWITTYTGKKFYPFAPKEDDVSIADIAHALSNICRFNGHCKTNYSVAEHSVRVSGILPPKLRLLGLMHDSPETYTTDMPSLIKHALPELQYAEKRILEVILHKYSINYTPEDWRAVKVADNAILAAECRDLGINTDGWSLPEPADPMKIVPSGHEEAEDAFLHAFQALIHPEAR